MDALCSHSQVQFLFELCHEIEAVWENRSERIRKWRELARGLESLPADHVLRRLLPLMGREPEQRRDLLTVKVPIQRVFEGASVPVDEGDREKPLGSPMDLCLVLENLRSAHNVGSIFRTAEALGCRHIYLVGYTPDIGHPQVQSACMGAQVTSSAQGAYEPLQELFQKEGRRVYALETATHAPSLFEMHLQFPAALIVGNERFGISQSTLRCADHLARLPVYGMKNSLNVANSLAVAGYEFRRQWNGTSLTRRV